MTLTDIQTHSDYLDLADVTDLKKWQLHRNRVEFGRQPLTLGMFIPCDKDGQPLEEPKPLGYHEEQGEYEWDLEQVKQYQQAKDRVLFEGFEFEEVAEGGFTITLYKGIFYGAYELSKNAFVGRKNNTIEGLIKHDLTLTPNAIKQLGL